MSRRLITLIATGLGLALLAWQIDKVGVAHILDGFRRIGPTGFALILGATLIRQLCRTFAWTLLLDAGVPLRRAFAATMSGDAIGNLTPLSLLASEPAKAMFVREYVAPPRALAALAAENFIYSLSVVVAVLTGVAVLFLDYQVSDALRTVSFVLIGGMLAVLVGALWLIAKEPALVSSTLGRFVGEGSLATIRDLETTTYSFVRSRPARLAGVIACEVTFHIASIAEAWITLSFLAPAHHSLALAVVLDTVQRVITVVFRVIPLRIGVDESGSGFMTTALDLGRGLGVTMGLIRKIRVLIWSGLGLLLLASGKSQVASGK
ncbi:MAG: lysylphosphatidylglycerol synthase domain-containing protein [Acidobacteriota bacterium]